MKRGITIRRYVKAGGLSDRVMQTRLLHTMSTLGKMNYWDSAQAQDHKRMCSNPTSSPCSYSPKVCSKLITCVSTLGIAFSTYSLTLNMKLSFI